MSNKCLVTKLDGVVNDNSLPRMGFIKVKVSAIDSPSVITQGFMVRSVYDSTLSIDGDGYFTDSTLTQNLGKTLECKANNYNVCYVSNGDFYVNIPKKLSTFIPKNTSSQNGTAVSRNKSFDISQLKLSTDMVFMEISNTGAFGDIAAFSNMGSITDLIVSNAKGLYGDIGSLKGCSSLSTFYAESTNLGGDIANLPNVNFCIIQGSSGFYGDIENMPNISHGYFQGNNITGDVSKLNSASLLTGATCNYSWKTERDSSKTIIAFINGNFGDDLDAMLINQAKCVAGSIKNFTVEGNRTSASDAAVTTLKQKGYNVTINGVAL